MQIEIDTTFNDNKEIVMTDLKKRIVEVGLKLMKHSYGALFVVGNNSDYDLHFPNFFDNNNISVFEEGIDKVLVQLAAIDGAVIIDSDGFIRAYGARILNTATLKGFGTRHAAARGASLREDFVMLVSEEDTVLRLFKDGAVALEVKPK